MMRMIELVLMRNSLSRRERVFGLPSLAAGPAANYDKVSFRQREFLLPGLGGGVLAPSPLESSIHEDRFYSPLASSR